MVDEDGGTKVDRTVVECSWITYSCNKKQAEALDATKVEITRVPLPFVTWPAGDIRAWRNPTTTRILSYQSHARPTRRHVAQNGASGSQGSEHLS